MFNIDSTVFVLMVEYLFGGTKIDKTLFLLYLLLRERNRTIEELNMIEAFLSDMPETVTHDTSKQEEMVE